MVATALVGDDLRSPSANCNRLLAIGQWPTVRREKSDVVGELLLHFLARDDGVDESVVQKKLSSLKSGRQFSLRGVLDDSRAGKTNHGARFGKDQVTDRCETGHNTGHGRIGQNADEW